MWNKKMDFHLRFLIPAGCLSEWEFLNSGFILQGDQRSDSWVRVSSMNGRRVKAATAVLQQQIFVMGGCPNNYEVTASCEVYNIAFDMEWNCYSSRTKVFCWGCSSWQQSLRHWWSWRSWEPWPGGACHRVLQWRETGMASCVPHAKRKEKCCNIYLAVEKHFWTAVQNGCKHKQHPTVVDTNLQLGTTMAFLQVVITLTN